MVRSLLPEVSRGLGAITEAPTPIVVLFALMTQFGDSWLSSRC